MHSRRSAMTRPPLFDELGARLRNLAEQTPLADLDMALGQL